MTDPPAPVEPAPSPEPRRKREAGRNLPLAIGTGVLLGGALLTTLVLSRPAFVGFLLVIVVLALLELLAVLLTILAAFAWYLIDRQRTEVTRNVAATVLATVYVPFMAAHLALVLRQAEHY